MQVETKTVESKEVYSHSTIQAGEVVYVPRYGPRGCLRAPSSTPPTRTRDRLPDSWLLRWGPGAFFGVG